MQFQFLKIGSRLVNLAKVTEIDLENPCSKPGQTNVLIRYGDEYDATAFYGDEAEAIREHFNSDTDVIDVTPAVALEDMPL